MEGVQKESKKRRRVEDSDAERPVKLSKALAGDRTPPSNEVPEQTAAEFCAEHSMEVTGGPGFVCPPPMSSFSSTPFAPVLKSLLTASGFTAPTATQAMAWPLAMNGANIITVAKTGSGKTLGFLLPVLQQLREAGARPAGRPSVLGMAPTRELACQTEVVANQFGKAVGLRAACVYGGAPKSLQIRQLREGVDIIIGTPGRLQDLMDMGVLSLASVK